MGWINDAVDNGAGKAVACHTLGISIRTLQRWSQGGDVKEDQRPIVMRESPSNKLTEAERDQLIEVCNQPQFASLPPSQIVPIMADEGQYLASESTFYRVLNERGQLNHRGRSKQTKRSKPPTTHTATQAKQVWSWDISYRAPNLRRCH